MADTGMAPLPLEKRLNKMQDAAQTMVLIFAVILLATGGLLSIKAEWARDYDKDSIIIPADDRQYYATAMLNLVSGILYAITAIGLYARTQWGRKLNVVSSQAFDVCRVGKTKRQESTIVNSWR